MIQRRTIAAPVTIAGPALFNGLDSALVVQPAPTQSGLCFRADSKISPIIIDQVSDKPAHPIFESQRPRCTSVRAGKDSIAMIEHAMAALAGLGVTDAILETTSTELPILDGSARDLTKAIQAVGIVKLEGSIQPIQIRKTIEYHDRDATIIAEPCDTTDYTYHLDYGPDSPIPESTARWLGDPEDFAQSIAPARTFSTATEANQMKKLGLFCRFTPADLLVIDHDGPIENTLRFPDECARHKLLDLIGDLALLGRPLHAKVRAHKSGHADTHALCQLILNAQ